MVFLGVLSVFEPDAALALDGNSGRTGGGPDTVGWSLPMFFSTWFFGVGTEHESSESPERVVVPEEEVIPQREGGRDEREEPENCAFRCLFHRAIDALIDFPVRIIQDPIALWNTWRDALNYAAMERLDILVQVFGFIVLFVVLNISAYAYRRVRDVVRQVRCVTLAFFRLPFLSLVIETIISVWKSFMDLAKDDKEKAKEGRKEGPKEGHVSAVHQPFDESRLEELEKELEQVKRLLTEALNNKDGGSGSGERVQCDFCGRLGHSELNCFKKRQARGKAVKVWKPKPPQFGDQGAIASGEAAVSQASTGTENPILMYTPADINGIRFPRCLIDTGSEVNIFPLRFCTKYGFSYGPGSVKVLKGFNGAEGSVLGAMEATLKVGRDFSIVPAEFIVSSEISVPIIGLPTLKDMKIQVDCEGHELVHRESGSVVRCSMTTIQKN